MGARPTPERLDKIRAFHESTADENEDELCRPPWYVEWAVERDLLAEIDALSRERNDFERLCDKLKVATLQLAIDHAESKKRIDELEEAASLYASLDNDRYQCGAYVDRTESGSTFCTQESTHGGDSEGADWCEKHADGDAPNSSLRLQARQKLLAVLGNKR